MKILSKKHASGTFAVCLIVLIATNPGMKRFKEYRRGEVITTDRESRQANYFIFSTYSRVEQTEKLPGYDYTISHVTYVGVLDNFFLVRRRPV